MAYDQPSRPRRNTNDSTDIRLDLSRMPNNGDNHYPARSDEFNDGRKSYVPPSVQDEYNEEQRPTRIPSPPMSETSNAPSTEQQTVLSDEVIAHLTERIKKEVVEHLKQSGSIDNTTENSKIETVRDVEPVDDQSRSEPMARVPSNDKSCSTPSPPPFGQRVYTPPSPDVGLRRTAIKSDSPPLTLVLSPPDSPTSEKPSVRFMNSRSTGDKEGGRNGRPAAARSSFSSTELSTIDMKWGKLFDGDSRSTPRLGQVLRGLANHIIGDFHPKQSIVVTPDKMAAFYEKFAVDDEVYPLITIFKSQSHENLSDLYQELECQHHLVQEESFMKPVIPALTPEGFAQWMTTWILAFPDQESKRMQNVVMSMPIDADGEPVDGKPERLPKAISRHLFPSREHSESKKTIRNAIFPFLDDFRMSRARNPSITSPPMVHRASTSMQPRTRPIDIQQTSPPNRGSEKDPMQYSKSPSDAGFLRESASIERRRQLYTAKPGSGKVYVDNLDIPDTNRLRRANSTGRTSRDHEPEPECRPRHVRTHSNASSSRPGGSRRAPSPSTQNGSQSNPSNLDPEGNYLSDKYSSPPKPPPLSPTSSYTTNRYSPSSSEMRDRDRYVDNRRSERRSTNDGPRSRRNTVNDSSRLPLDITIPRSTERWDQMYENKDKSRDRDRERKSEPKSAGPILHQEFRPEGRTPVGDSPGEEWYFRGHAPPPATRVGEYEGDKEGKYYERR